MYIRDFQIDDVMPLLINTHDNTNAGEATDADAAPTFRVYEILSSTPVQTGTLTPSDGANTTGYYEAYLFLSTANGYADNKDYHVYIEAVVGGVTGTTHRQFSIGKTAAGGSVDVNAIRDAILDRLLLGNHDTEGTPGRVLSDLPDSLSSLADGIDDLQALMEQLDVFSGPVVIPGP